MENVNQTQVQNQESQEQLTLTPQQIIDNNNQVILGMFKDFQKVMEENHRDLSSAGSLNSARKLRALLLKFADRNQALTKDIMKIAKSYIDLSSHLMHTSMEDLGDAETETENTEETR